MIELNKIYNEDCLEGMKRIEDKSIDMILCDLPYGTTACKWDTIIPFDPLWEQYERIIKDNGAIVLFGSEPFSSKLRMSNICLYKYDWKWIKDKPTGFQHAKNRPMMKQEDICVVSKSPMGHVSQLGNRRMKYFPQGVVSSGEKTISENTHGKYLGKRQNQVGKNYESMTGFPNNLLFYPKESKYIHPTQKPVALFEYLIKTYTNENEIILDNCMGSGTTAIACINTNRNFIGFELDTTYCSIANQRIQDIVSKTQ